MSYIRRGRGGPGRRFRRSPGGLYVPPVGGAWSPDDFANLYINAQDSYTTSGSQVTAWLNPGLFGDGNVTGANAIEIADAEVTTGASIRLNDPSENTRIEFGTAADAKILHDGSGSSLAILFHMEDAADTSQALWGTKTDTVVSQVGSGSRIRGDGSYFWKVSNGSVNLIDVLTPAGEFPANQWNVVGHYVGNNSPGTADWEVWKATAAIEPVMLASDEVSGSFSTANANSVLRVGCRGGGISWYWEGRVAAVLLGSGNHMSDMMAYLRALIV